MAQSATAPEKHSRQSLRNPVDAFISPVRDAIPSLGISRRMRIIIQSRHIHSATGDRKQVRYA
ncbi:MAG: hypothetical protein ABI876_17750, partial [Bacteroidota bacterium]